MEQPPEQHKFTSLAAAARATGKSRTTIQRALKSGKVSYDLDDNGNYIIDPAELNRVFPLKSDVTGGTHSAPQNGTPRNSDGTGGSLPDIRILQTELKAAQEMVAERGRTIEDLRDRLNSSERRMTALLTDQRQSAPETATGRHRTHWVYWVAFLALLAVAAFLYAPELFSVGG